MAIGQTLFNHAEKSYFAEYSQEDHREVGIADTFPKE